MVRLQKPGKCRSDGALKNWMDDSTNMPRLRRFGGWGFLFLWHSAGISPYGKAHDGNKSDCRREKRHACMQWFL